MKILMLMFLLIFISCKGGGGAGSIADTTATTGGTTGGAGGGAGAGGGGIPVVGVDTHHAASEAIFTIFASQYAASVGVINAGLATNYKVWNAVTYPFVYKDTGFGIVSGFYIECKTYPDGTHDILVGNGWETYSDVDALGGYAGVSTRKAVVSNFVYTAVAKCVNNISDPGINTIGGASTLAGTYGNVANVIINYNSQLSTFNGVSLNLNQEGSPGGNWVSRMFVTAATSGYTKAYIASILIGSTHPLQLAETEIDEHNYDVGHGTTSPDANDAWSSNTDLRADHWFYLRQFIVR